MADHIGANNAKQREMLITKKKWLGINMLAKS